MQYYQNDKYPIEFVLSDCASGREKSSLLDFTISGKQQDIPWEQRYMLRGTFGIGKEELEKLAEAFDFSVIP